MFYHHTLQRLSDNSCDFANRFDGSEDEGSEFCVLTTFCIMSIGQNAAKNEVCSSLPETSPNERRDQEVSHNGEHHSGIVISSCVHHITHSYNIIS